MAKIFLGLGSNIGDRRAHIERAIGQLLIEGITIIRCADMIETDPVGGPPQGKYLNTVISGETTFSPEDLLAAVKAIERRIGRTPSIRNGPRVIDIDILLYDHRRMQTAALTLPHPRMRERDFVLIPLRQIAPLTVEELFHEHYHTDPGPARHSAEISSA
jgi:2-amino-4-hydroxy-6-hydroxymethyldihydropteridine diphosphokinase